MRTRAFIVIAVVVSATAALGQSGGSYQITNSVIANGGGASTDGNSNGLVQQSTVGEPAAGTLLRNPPYSQTAGFSATTIGLTPTAGPAVISGRIFTSNGVPLAGVVMTLSGSSSTRTISDADGAYVFTNLDANGFYSVAPLRVNFSFSPMTRSLSLIGNRAEAIFIAIPGNETANPLDTPEFFVRQQYVDFLSREPDQSGFEYWSWQINQCGSDQSCVRARRIDVSNAFFYEQEFQETGGYLYRIYKAAFDWAPTYSQFSLDHAQLIGGTELDPAKTDFARAFVQRAEFTAQYPETMIAAGYVDALNAKSGNVLTAAEREELVNGLISGSETRATVLRKLADNAAFVDREYNASFVLTQYFGYLRRDPDRAGYDFWLDQVNRHPLRDVGIQHAMVCSFVTSAEYQRRFSAVVSRSNNDCGP